VVMGTFATSGGFEADPFAPMAPVNPPPRP
jgi:hypothetical protein